MNVSLRLSRRRSRGDGGLCPGPSAQTGAGGRVIGVCYGACYGEPASLSSDQPEDPVEEGV